MKTRLFIFAALVSAALLPSSLFAQVAEIDPYGGFYWPGSVSRLGSFENNQLLGVRGGYYITPGLELGGNWGWSNHFHPSSGNAASRFAGDLGFPQGKVRANIWEAEVTYNFAHHLGTEKVKPYVGVGIGGLTTRIKDPSTFVLNVRPVVTPAGKTVYVANDVLDSSNTYFNVSYGGGLKLNRLWGPMGAFGDIRGRTVPNFFSNTWTWPELSAGLTFGWGQR